MASPTSPNSTPPTFLRQWGPVIGLLLLHLVVCLQTAAVKSITHDEIWHLPVGVRNWHGDFAADNLNPPITRLWSAIPLVLAGVQVHPELNGPDLGKDFVLSHPDDFQRWYFWGRAFNIVWSLATGLVVYLWTVTTFGRPSALLALLLYSTCPDIIAHASLVTPDTAVMFGFLSTLAMLCRWTETLRWRDAMFVGLFLGIAEGVKYTAILLAPVVVVVAVIRLWPKRSQWSRGAAHLAGLSLFGVFVLAATYGFQGVFHSLSQFDFQSTGLRTLKNLLGGTPFPFPADYLRGVDIQRSIMEGAHAVYLDGTWSLTGFRSYYLKALLYKIPHVTQLLILGGGLALVLRRGEGRPATMQLRFDRQPWIEILTLLLPMAVLLGVASVAGMQLGLRYVQPVLPLLMIVGGQSTRWTAGWGLPQRRWGAAVVTCLCLASLRHHPHHLAFFNEFAGGPVGGRAHLIDSNLDWGQDLDLVRDYMREHNLQQIGLAYFGTLPPGSLGIDYTIPPSREPQPGLYAVSVNFVMGRPHGLLMPDGSTRAVDFQEFGYFRFFEPVATLGGSIDIYEVTADDVRRFRGAF